MISTIGASAARSSAGADAPLDRLAARERPLPTPTATAAVQSSRTSLLLGLRPTTTGIYGLEPSFRRLPELADRQTLPQYFAAHGYGTYGAGKIFHGGVASGGPGRDASRLAANALLEPDFLVTGPAGGIGARPPHKLIPPTPMGNHPLMDWGCFPHRDEDKGDYQVASWAVEQIRDADRDTPFFITAGFFLPHVPCYATQAWFDLYPDDESILPEILTDDRDDTPRFSWYLHWQLPEPRLGWLKENHQWVNLVRSYLACISFVDAQVGRLLDALDQSGQADNTLIVLWSDHGWHLGEKLITGKNSLWDRGTRVPLIFAGPGVATGAECDQPSELLDIYPSLIDLCGLTPRDDLEGLSLRPQLENSSRHRARPAITSHNQGNHAVRSQRFRYIRYADGSQELYDYGSDPAEWHNLAADPRYSAIVAEHRGWLPSVDRPPAEGSAHRVLTYDAHSDQATWEGTRITRADPIPQ